MSRRPSLRTSVTTLGRKVERLITEVPVDVSELRVTVTQLQDKATRLASIDEEVQGKMEEDFSHDPTELQAKMTEEMQTSEGYRDNISRWITLGNEAIAEATQRITNATSSTNHSGASTPSQSSALGSQNQATSAFRLPEFKLPKFTGEDVLRFPSYWDQFRSLVHLNPTLTDVQRFCLLKESLTGTPYSLVDGLMVTSENYQKAMELLEESYNDPNLLLGIFVSRLHSQQSVKDVKSHQLQKLVSHFEQSFHEIQNLIRRLQGANGQLQVNAGNMAVVEYFLTPHLLSKLPEELQISWYNRSTEPQTRFNFAGLLAYLKENMKSRQACRLLTGAPQTNNYTQPGPSKPWKPNSSHGRPHSVTSALLVDQNQRCPKCYQEHKLWACPGFGKLDVQEKWDFVKKHKRCFNCLTSTHGIGDCKSQYTCRYCHKKHHSSLCKNKPTTTLSATADSFMPKSQAPLSKTRSFREGPGSYSPSFSGLTAVPSDTSGATGNTVPRVEGSFLTQPQQDTRSLLQIIKLRISNPSTGNEKVIHALFDSGASQTWVRQDLAAELGLKIQQKTNFTVQSFGGQTQHLESYHVCFELTSMDGTSGVIPCDAYTSKNITGALEQCKTKKLPSHLRGLDLSNTPAYQNLSVYPSLLIGARHYWSFLTGELIKGRPTAVRTVFGWCLSGPTDNHIVAEDTSTEIFTSAHVERIWDLCSLGILEKPQEVQDLITPVLKDGRYEVNLPFKGNRRPGSNYEQALQRSLTQERKLSPDKIALFDQYFDSSLKEGIIVKMREDDPALGYYLPFHGIWKNGKLRVVFDGSSKDRQTNTSLNDTLHPGENMLNQLYDVLLRFRQFRYPIVGDIEKAFHQISIAPNDRIWLKFVWKNCTYAFARAPFGVTTSPHLLQICLRHRFRELDDRQLGRLLEKGHYVDDFPLSFVSEEERSSFREDAVTALAEVGMTLSENAKSDKVLGVKWNRITDEFLLDLTEISSPKRFTKRELLRCLASIYDPLGLLGPIVMRLKLLFQSTWKTPLSWDESLPPELKKAWEIWLEDARALKLVIPRWVGLSKGPWTLACFTDASLACMGVTLYCVIEGHSSNLLASKTRLCPIKPNNLSVPRAELVAILLGIRAIDRMISELEPPTQVYLFTDADTCLHWIKSPPPKSEVFLFNRIKEIREKAVKNQVQFRHVRTHLNPADAPTKGMTASVLSNSQMWLHGPGFLLQPHSEWPSEHEVIPTEACLTTTGSKNPPPLFPLEQFSSLSSVISTTVWLRRFTQYIRNKKQASKDPVTPMERNESLLYWIRHEQRLFYEDEFSRLQAGTDILASSSLVKLRPKWDSERSLITLTSRTHEKPLILLPPKGFFTKLVIQESHARTLHQGAFTTLCELRRDYWLPHGMSRVKKVIFDCRSCRRFRTRLFETQESALPKFRVTAAPAFSHFAVDHFGPLTLPSGSKVWTLVFSCAVTRAIHLELCHDMTTHESFLRLRSFLALRVPPHTIVHVYSDNSTTFRKLARMKFPHHQVQWRFAIPANPSSMGLVERMVGLTKRVLRASFRHTSLPKDELAIVLQEVAACLNLRPLTPLSTDARDDTPLTPSSFIHGLPPPPTLLDHQVAPTISLQRRYLQRCRLSEDIWRRWYRQYLPLLRGWRQKTRPKEPFIKPGDLVLVETPTSRGLWPVARVEKLIRGPDGVVRAAHIRLRGHPTRRALRHLAPLETAPEPQGISQSLPLSPEVHKDSAPLVLPEVRTRSGRVVRPPSRH